MIELKDVSLSFGEKSILEKFNIAIKKGDKVLIIGKSGVGKSSILKLILGFIEPSMGEIIVGDEKLSGKSVWEIRKRIAYLSQRADIPNGVVNNFIDEIISYKANVDVKKEDIYGYLEKLDLSREILSSKAEKLSGGERQRVAIAITLMLNREILILDEGTASLDGDMKNRVVDLIVSLPNTVVAVSHDKEWMGQDGIREVEIKR